MSRFILVDIDFINLSFQFNKQTRRKDKNLIFSFFFYKSTELLLLLAYIYIYINLKSFLKNFRNQKFVYFWKFWKFQNLIKFPEFKNQISIHIYNLCYTALLYKSGFTMINDYHICFRWHQCFAYFICADDAK